MCVYRFLLICIKNIRLQKGIFHTALAKNLYSDDDERTIVAHITFMCMNAPRQMQCTHPVRDCT